MIEINENCTGCLACCSVCPQKCITAEYDNEGFVYPKFNKSECINCGLCDKVCINYNKKSEVEILTSYAACSKEKEKLIKSSSGGVFSEFSKLFLNLGGIVYGAAFVEDFSVKHIRCDSIDKLSSIMTSKYLQSDTEGVFVQVKEDLDNGCKVLFSGTPCQCNSLNHFLRKEYSNLFCVAVICHGVPSPIVWTKYLDSLKSQFSLNDIKYINFRDKTFGWKKFSLRIDADNGYSFIEPLTENAYFRLFLNNYILRPSCYNCNSKYPNILADVILGDFWGVDLLIPELFDDKGMSLVLLCSENAVNYYNEICKFLNSREIDYRIALPHNTALYSSVYKPDGRNECIKSITCSTTIVDFKNVANAYCKKKRITLKQRVLLLIYMVRKKFKMVK